MNFLDFTGLNRLVTNIKNNFVSKNEIGDLSVEDVEEAFVGGNSGDFSNLIDRMANLERTIGDLSSGFRPYLIFNRGGDPASLGPGGVVGIGDATQYPFITVCFYMAHEGLRYSPMFKGGLSNVAGWDGTRLAILNCDTRTANGTITNSSSSQTTVYITHIFGWRT